MNKYSNMNGINTSASDVNVINQRKNISELHIESPIDTNDFKDALLASLYSQVEFLKSQIEEKDLLIRSLLIKEADVYAYPEVLSRNSSNQHSDENIDALYEVVSDNNINSSDESDSFSSTGSSASIFSLEEEGDEEISN